ncbi:LysR family transcriptional regulator [Bordetella bronchiseptica]|uniref:LysR family transcriptional regulator n=1 Tax=Bordetella bronchiseptica TaxID=518 RepID=UPI00049FA35F|nr:LysR family transcriptional regulator [Bordetella bronchiseptica]AWP83731.1 LysR family transcriptional regulator [Bordetella bronchiseptica]AWQ09299.1 LysR family transcriptional regulator [Bordetella bronchiseptica]AXT90323.1 LysR family transcriptional regulator [Bordetella bronchiseptica]KDD34169.1 LysR substrate-binding domain protein [Bordetella bronchiseptica MBORD849]WLS57832.1 LysR family transcriptional regulator [Bordetella bronchiseptica]
MDLRQLQQFVVLSETLNFHRAAERLHMAQPPLSTAIRKLEDELGIVLFDRKPRSLSLTVAGAAMLKHARRTLSNVDELQRCAREYVSGDQGRIVVGFSNTASNAVLPRILHSFQARYPRVELVLHESTTHELVSELAAHTVDVALLRTPLFDACDAELIDLEQDHFILAVPADHPLAQQSCARLADLDGQRFIAFSREKVPAMHAIISLAFGEAGVTPKVVQQIVQVPTAIALAESGIGMALVPSAAARYLRTGARLLPMVDLPASLRIGIALGYDALTASAATLRFVENTRAVHAAAPPPAA